MKMGLDAPPIILNGAVFLSSAVWTKLRDFGKRQAKKQTSFMGTVVNSTGAQTRIESPNHLYLFKEVFGHENSLIQPPKSLHGLFGQLFLLFNIADILLE